MAPRQIAVAATGPFGADVLERLAAQHDVVQLLTRPDKPRGRGRRVASPPARDAAERLGIPALQPERLDESVELGADTVVVCAYGLLIPNELLERALWLNVHPSLLPRWRGAAPVERAILAGDDETGVTIHRTVEALDAGPVPAQRAFAIGPDDDAGAVYARAAEIAAELLRDVLAQEFGCRLTCVERAPEFVADAPRLVAEAGLEDRIELVEADGANFELGGYDATLCIGATFVYGGLVPTIERLRPTAPLLAVGEPYWRTWPLPPVPELHGSSLRTDEEEWRPLAETVERAESAGVRVGSLLASSEDD